MDFGLSDEQRMILQTVREFVRKEVAPLLPEIQKRSVARNLLRDYVRLDEWA